MSFNGGKKSFVVLKVFLLIGAVVGVLMASGTIQTLVYYSIKYITPSLFVLFTFLICCITSFLIGTSLGTVSIVVYVSCSLAGIFEGIKMFHKLKDYLIKRSLTGCRLFGATLMVSTLTAVFGCNQSISMVMTNEFMKDCYTDTYKYKFALHLENSGILISALIPWNLAALVPTTTLNISATGYLPYAFYLYIVPIVYFIYCKYSDENKTWGRSENSISNNF